MRWTGPSVLLFALSMPAPAGATNWVQVDPFNWIDLDSVVRISGGLVSYRNHHDSAPPSAGATGRPSGVDCVNRRWYWMENGQLVPVPDEPDLEPYVSDDDPTFLKLCQ